jgi:hypothetical protein
MPVFEMLDIAHHYNHIIECIGEHLCTHVYPETEGDKASNNVAFLIMKMLVKSGVLKEGKPEGKLTIIFDNCIGQIKSNIVLQLVPYLV